MPLVIITLVSALAILFTTLILSHFFFHFRCHAFIYWCNTRLFDSAHTRAFRSVSWPSTRTRLLLWYVTFLGRFSLSSSSRNAYQCRINSVLACLHTVIYSHICILDHHIRCDASDAVVRWVLVEHAGAQIVHFCSGEQSHEYDGQQRLRAGERE